MRLLPLFVFLALMAGGVVYAIARANRAAPADAARFVRTRTVQTPAGRCPAIIIPNRLKPLTPYKPSPFDERDHPWQ